MTEEVKYLMYINGDDGKFLGSLREVEGKLVFEGNASEAAKVFFNELIKLNKESKK